MKRLLLYAVLALAVFSLTYCSNNSTNENAGNTTDMNSSGTNSTKSTDTSAGTGTYDTLTSTDVGKRQTPHAPVQIQELKQVVQAAVINSKLTL